MKQFLYNIHKKYDKINEPLRFILFLMFFLSVAAIGLILNNWLIALIFVFVMMTIRFMYLSGVFDNE